MPWGQANIVDAPQLTKVQKIRNDLYNEDEQLTRM